MIQRSHILRAAAVVALSRSLSSRRLSPRLPSPRPAAQKADYKASDVVEQLARQDLGRSRAICIGTASECGAPVVARPRASI